MNSHYFQLVGVFCLGYAGSLVNSRLERKRICNILMRRMLAAADYPAAKVALAGALHEIQNGK